MNLATFYDTETTGLPLWREPSGHDGQPHLVQLAAHQVDMDTLKIVQSIDLIIRPESWVIPADVSEIHGITNEYAMDVGLREDLVVDMFLDLWKPCQSRIAHNESFDARIIRIATKRYFDAPIVDGWKEGHSECTMNMATPICKMPPSDKMKAKNMKGPKKANMGEAYEFFTGQPLLDAHTAIADVNACMEVYWAIKDRDKSQLDIEM